MPSTSKIPSRYYHLQPSIFSRATDMPKVERMRIEIIANHGAHRPIPSLKEYPLSPVEPLG